ncbi:unnamed protein product [Pseudo-nitzschia multistriata]|uniref:Signal recognition particle subunit SRP72 n=1 Tax=Pseudo-nitzschia multistriata TaxID=183589 RepID=A0A448Z8B9_9STRA|nr:unnamed protein product [Pseudo-nitzschia multistriata]
MSAAAKPSDIIVKFLQEIVESWKSKRYQKVSQQCVALLKRKKTIENLGMTVPLQRILLQAYMQEDKYEKVLEWDKASASATKGCEDLILYARYRTEDYANASKQAATAAAGTNDGQDHSCAVAFKNLQAQSDFHLNRTEEGLAGYLDLLSNEINENDPESKMEILTNALALIASSACTPGVAIHMDENNETTKFLLEEAEAALSNDDDAVDEEMLADLASNLGCIRFLTDPTTTENNWLEQASAAIEAGDGSSEQTNLQWSKHFWYRDIEDITYENVPSSKASNQVSVVQSIAKINQSLLDENLSRLPPQPHPKWNLLQVRMYWYDRAILQLKAGKYVECHDSCQSLKKTLSNKGASDKKKKNKTGSGGAEATGGAQNASSPAALWWETRADVVLAYAQQNQSKRKDASVRLSNCIHNLQAAASSSSSSSMVLDHAMAHALLHQFVMEQKGNKKDRQRQKRELLSLLKSLPDSIQSRPAVQLTMDDLETVVNNDSESNNNKANSTPKSPLEEADILFGQGQYEEACKLYEGALSNGSDDSILDSQLRYVQALAMSGQHEASQELWQSLESSVLGESTPVTASLPSGDVLETKTLPRGTSSNRSSISKKLAAASNPLEEEETDKPSREKILRRRARKREVYLKQLESKGKYNPDRPTKPDPERWIPKNERSRSGRNRGGKSNKGLNSAQGGGSRLDAQRLDAAARRAGKVPVSAGPSSANLKVSSGGRKGGRRR